MPDPIIAALAERSGLTPCSGAECFMHPPTTGASTAADTRRCPNCGTVVRGTCQQCRAVVLAALRYAILGEMP